MSALGLSASTATVINFDSFPLGKTPPGWIVAHPGSAPRWEVRKDQTAPTQPYVLAQVSEDPSGGRSPLAILDGPVLRDGEVSVRLKPIAGKDALSGGVVWRYRDENNYYLARADAWRKDVGVYKVENGRRTQILALAKHDIPVNGWSILKIATRGDKIQVYVDHRRVLEGRDNTFGSGGKVGLWTAAGSVMYFDDFRVYAR